MTMTKATRCVDRSAIVCVRSAKLALAAGMLAAMIGTLCVGRVARGEAAAPTLADHAGRWVSTEKHLTLDLSPCGNGWCGVVVTGEACGYTALRISETPADAQYGTPKRRGLSGRLQLAPNTQAYVVRTELTRDDRGLTLFIAGQTGAVFSPIRRTFDYRGLFARTGDAACAPSPTTS